MKTHFTPRFAHAVAPLLCATAFIATPAFAQETTAVPPVVVTPPQSATVPPPPVVRTVPDTPPEAAAPAAEPVATPAPRAATRSTATRTATRTTTARPAPVRAAPAPEPAPAPVAVAPEPQPAAPAPQPEAAPAPAPVAAAPAESTAATDTATTSTSTGVPVWAWVGGALAALAILAIGLFALRRRRVEEDYYAEPYVEEAYVEPAYVEPVAVAAVAEPMPVAKVEPRKEPEFLRRTETAAIEPIAVAPDEVHIVEPAADEVAELTAGTAPVAERPWLEFAMRPVRAGTNVDEALVEIELTVGNAGSVAAKDVRISTFLLSSDPNGTEMERLLVQPPADATTDPVTIDPGEGKRIDATLALLKSEMGEDLPASFRPIVVADARYTLADGTEGRTSASFEIGVTPEEGEGLEPIELSRASMFENVGAELHSEPQHA